jgi:glycosyl transferase family 25
MRILVINLERSSERRLVNEQQFAQAGIAFEFFKAVDGHAPDQSHPVLRHYDAGRCVGFYGKPLTPGAIGCYASHYLAWQRCVELGEPVLIMEDDVRVLPSLAGALQALRPLMAHYPLIRLFGLNEHPHRVVRQVGEFELIRFLRGPAGLQAYAVSPDGAATLLAGSQWWREPVDRYVDRFWSHGIQSLALKPYPLAWGSQWESETRIWESRSTPFTFLRKIVRAAEHIGRHAFNLREDIRRLLKRP